MGVFLPMIYAASPWDSGADDPEWQQHKENGLSFEHASTWRIVDRADGSGSQAIIQMGEELGWVIITVIDNRIKSDPDSVSKELLLTLVDRMGMSAKKLQRVDTGEFLGYPGASYLIEEQSKGRPVQLRCQGRTHMDKLVVIMVLDVSQGKGLAPFQRLLNSLKVEKKSLLPEVP